MRDLNKWKLQNSSIRIYLNIRIILGIQIVLTGFEYYFRIQIFDFSPTMGYRLRMLPMTSRDRMTS